MKLPRSMGYELLEVKSVRLSKFRPCARPFIPSEGQGLLLSD